MGISYNAVNNKIMATGYSLVTPCTFWDLWNADNMSKPTSADKGSPENSKGLLLESGMGQGNGLAVNDQAMRLADSYGLKNWVFLSFPASDVTAPGMTCWTDFGYGACGNVIDNDEGTLLGAGAAPKYWSVDLGNGNAKTVIKLRMLFYSSNYAGKDFNIQGSNDNINWATLDTNQFAQTGNWQDIDFGNMTAYRYYKINFVNYWGNDPYIKQLELLEAPVVPNPVGKTVDFHGTDENGNLDENAIAFQVCTGALALTHICATSTKKFKTMNTIDLNGLGMNGAYEVYQERWGVAFKRADSSYEFTCTIRIGDGITFGYFADINKNVYADTGRFNFIHSQEDEGYIRLGNVKNESQKTGKQGCVITKKTINPQSDQVISGNDIFLYDSTFRGTNGMVKLSFYVANGRIWGCGGSMKIVSKPESMDLFSVMVTSEGLSADDFVINDFVSLGPIKNLFIYGAYYPFKLMSNQNGAYRFYNVVARDYNKLFYLRNLSMAGYNYVFQAIDWDVPEWSFLWENSQIITIYRQYTFNVKVIDENKNPYVGKAWTLKDKNGVTQYSGNTQADGRLSATDIIVLHGYFDQAGGNTEYISAPYSLWVDGETDYLDLDELDLDMAIKNIHGELTMVKVSDLITAVNGVSGAVWDKAMVDHQGKGTMGANQQHGVTSLDD